MTTTGVKSWSQTAATNASADSTVNWAEGMAPSAVNDSARAMMASTAKYRDDIAGAIVTGGTSTAYTVTSYQVFQNLTELNGQIVAFTPHTTSGGTCTLNVDSLGAKPLRSAPSVELPAGTLVQGTPYLALYNASDAAFYLHGFFNNPYTIPIGAMMDFTGSTAPNSSFVLPYGQAISRTTYSTYFGMVSTTYGSGDGSTTFNVPDLRGRVIAGKDDMGGSAASRLTSSYFGTSAASLGAVGGAQSHTLTLGELPTGITSSGTATVAPNGAATSWGIPYTPTRNSNPAFSFDSYGGGTNNPLVKGNNANTIDVATTMTGTASVTSNNTSGNAHATVQPTIVLNKLLRII